MTASSELQVRNEVAYHSISGVQGHAGELD